MKKYIQSLLTIIIVLVVITGCDFHRLGEKPLDQISAPAVWSSPDLMQANLNDIYKGMGNGLFNSTSGLSVLTDDALWNNGAKTMMKSEVTPGAMGLWGNATRFNYLNWGKLYSRIRETNIFLKKTADYSGDDQDKVKRMRGQIYFLRAFFYMNLMRTFGGAPLITKVYSLNSKDMTPPRNSFKETINFIVANADSAAAILPMSYSSSNLGHATKGAALALKSRVLLYAASDLYNKNPSGMPETGYTSATTAERKARWTKAQNAAKAVMDLGIYHLYKANPAPGDSTAENYANIFLNQPNSEIIMAKHFNHTHGAPKVGLWQDPNGYDGWGENAPTEQIVEAYEMKDGSKFSWNNSVEAAHPYQNRDPRFYATILYDGAHWKKRFPDAQSLDPVGIIQSFTTITLTSGGTLPGIDTRNGPIEDFNGSYTNYYLRKFIDPTNNYKVQQQEVPWPYFRYAEILLNYAEASINLKQDQKARDALNKIRRRAGMPDFDHSVTGKDLMEEYRNERRVEMAYELQRFFDVRRWMIASKVLDQNAKGIKITVKGKNRADRSSYHDYKYEVINARDRHWDDKMYFAPIPRAEMNRNKNLVQNPGYKD